MSSWKCHVGSPVGPKNLELGAYGSVLELGDVFWKFFLIFHQKKCSFFMQKKSVMSRFWSLRVGLQDWYVRSKLQVRPKSPSSNTALDFMGPYYLLTSTNRTEKCSWKDLELFKKIFFLETEKKQWKKLKKKKTYRSLQKPWILELGAYTGRSFDISNQAGFIFVFCCCCSFVFLRYHI